VTLYGIAEIAEAIRERPATVAQWRRRGKLPTPTADLKMGPVWTAEAIEPWIRGMGVYVVGERDEADARLIAAAPDLLEALQLALGAVQGSRVAGGLARDHVIHTARAAIAKATENVLGGCGLVSSPT
jgi:hypothetical protein